MSDALGARRLGNGPSARGDGVGRREDDVGRTRRSALGAERSSDGPPARGSAWAARKSYRLAFPYTVKFARFLEAES